MAFEVETFIKKHEVAKRAQPFDVEAFLKSHEQPGGYALPLTPKTLSDLVALKTVTVPPGVPTAAQEALQPPGREGLKGVIPNLFDPGVLLDPFNLAAGAGAGLKTGAGLLKGIGQAASGLYGPIAGFGKGFIKGIRTPLPPPPQKPSVPPAEPEPTGPYSSETGKRGSSYTPAESYTAPSTPPEKPAFVKNKTGAYVEVKPPSPPKGPTRPQATAPAVPPKITPSAKQKPVKGKKALTPPAATPPPPLKPAPWVSPQLPDPGLLRTAQQVALAKITASETPGDVARLLPPRTDKLQTAVQAALDRLDAKENAGRLPFPYPIQASKALERGLYHREILKRPVANKALRSQEDLLREKLASRTPVRSMEELLQERLATRGPGPTLREQQSFTPTGSSKSIESFVTETLKPLLKKDPHTLVETPPGHPPTAPATAPVPEKPITLNGPAATQTVQQTAQQAKSVWDKWPVDRKLITNVPQTPVISLNEKFHVDLNNDLQQLVESPSFKALVKIKPEERLTQAVQIEQQAIDRYRALVQGGMEPKAATAKAISEIPEPWRGFFKVGREKEQTARAILGLPPLREVEGPYFAHVTADDSRELFTLLGQEGSVGNHLHTTAGVFEKTREFPTMADGLKAGLAYDDPLKAIVLREWAGTQIVRTAEFLEALMRIGVITPVAKTGGLSPHRFVLEGLPSSPAFAVKTREEAQFLQQNFGAKGKVGAYYHILNQAFRNPNLWNPLPHIVKNMGVKYWMAGGNPARLKGDAAEYQAGTDPLVQRFKAVMPFTEHGKTEADLMGPYVHPSKFASLLIGVGMANAISSKIVFAKADPVMRYSLWKSYIKKGFPDQAAANHVWVDLIRYSMRSELVDTWKSIPFNFFVPWRVGSVISISKNLRLNPMRTGLALAAKPALSAVTRPVRTALVLGILDLVREHYYRQTGETFHMPADYVEGPITKLIDDPKAAPYLAATMFIFGPGGEHVAQQLKQMLELMQGSGDMDVVKRMFWGVAQGSTMAEHLVQFEQDGNVDHLVKLLAESATGLYQTSGYQPHHLSKYVPEALIPKDDRVRTLEQYRDAKKARSLLQQEHLHLRKESRDEAMKALTGGR